RTRSRQCSARSIRWIAAEPRLSRGFRNLFRNISPERGLVRQGSAANGGERGQRFPRFVRVTGNASQPGRTSQMIRKLLATTALTAFAATGAYAQAANEITVQPGDTVIIEAEREDAQINLRFQSGDLAGAPQDGTQQQAETGQAQDQQMAQEGQTGQAETLDRGQFEATDLQQISADDLIGSDVYSAQDENIGSVGDVLLTEDGQVDAIVVDVGGFLGMGANEVAL